MKMRRNNNIRRPYSRQRQIVRVVKQKPFKSPKEAIEYLEQTKEFVLLNLPVKNSTIEYNFLVFQNPSFYMHSSISVAVKMKINDKEITLRKDLDTNIPDYENLYRISMHKNLMSSQQRKELGDIVTKIFSEFFMEGLLTNPVFQERFIKPLFQ